MKNQKVLAAQIDSSFALPPLTSIERMFRHGSDCLECSNLKAEFANTDIASIEWRQLALIGASQRHLAPNAWCWFVAQFLRHILRVEHIANHLEIDSLIYFLSPAQGGEGEAEECLGALSLPQFQALNDVLQWIAQDEFWQDYAGADLKAALTFVHGEMQKK